ncbi:YraN family protein [Candidatus Saccharibacteria bacterium]|nr:YraN family protein [Candidatus Saccharibacteria bacterium]MBI3338114.1 YraN family protein [Candidatus Saccharibacteria bacterium]
MITNYQTGHDAEKTAAEYLKKRNFKIRELNWRTRFCEIDIVAEKDNIIYFVEVKYRKNNSQGTGLEYITKSKLKKMRFAADLWVSSNNWEKDYQMAALAIDNQTITFVDNI